MSSDETPPGDKAVSISVRPDIASAKSTNKERSEALVHIDRKLGSVETEDLGNLVKVRAAILFQDNTRAEYEEDRLARRAERAEIEKKEKFSRNLRLYKEISKNVFSGAGLILGYLLATHGYGFLGAFSIGIALYFIAPTFAMRFFSLDKKQKRGGRK